MEAKQTEYRGVVFRSKSEAQLALLFDKSCLGVTGWIYEPTSFEQEDGYNIDFLLFLGTKIFLVEYKPKEPTQTYYQKFIERTEKYEDTLGLIYGSILIFGSAYCGEYFEYKNEIKHEKIEAFNFNLIQQIKEHRFDLK